MKKLSPIVFLFASCFIHAQQVPVSITEVHPVSGEPLRYCGTTEATQELFKKHPELKEVAERIKRQQAGEKINPLPAGTVLYVPVVVHILHNYGPENIPDANVYDAINLLNKDYRHLAPDTTTITAPFKSLAADCEIQFQLAQLDPNGNCTNGIDRIATSLTYAAGSASQIDQWPPDKYLNIWVVHDIASGAAGYANFPADAAAYPASDGIVILYNYFSSLPPSSLSNGRILDHETGHWANLEHTWGSANGVGVACGDDGIPDTPITKGWNICTLTNNDICNPGSPENVQNIMEYSYCLRMFTLGQKTRMWNALNSSIAGRNNLISAANLAATGVNTASQLCTSNFSANKTVVCVGTNISFTDQSWNAAATSWQWDFDNNSTVDATTQNPTYSYSAPGIYAVTLTVSDGVSTKTTTKTDYITVMGNTATQTAPYSEGFENTGFPYSDSYVNTLSGVGPLWSRTTAAAYSGSASIMLDNYLSSSSDVDELITP